MMREGLEGSESPRRTAVAGQQTLLQYRLKRATQAAIMQAVFSSMTAAFGRPGS
jgi:hypothetical protein